MDRRLTELEVKLAFAEDLLDAVNATIYRQQQRIELLERQVRELREQLAASLPPEARSPREEIPPHY
jgi:SlyX protein